jgi:DNA polymerase (family 10)
VDRIIAELRQHPGVHNLSAAGSVRRFKETVGDIDLMGTADDPEAILQAFVALPEVRQVIGAGTTKASVVADPGLQVDFRVVEHDSFGSLLQYFTGSKQHNILLRDKEHRRGLKLSEFGITDLDTGELEKFSTEEGFYSRLGLQLIPPELREGGAEIEKAEQGALPRLVEPADIKGDLHVHSNWSDGRSSIEDLVSAARALGYEYLAITDHSAGRGIAHGLNEERLRRQIQEIKRINESSAGPWLLAGIEVDIRADGRLDLPDELLEELDIVIAAVHSSMGQDERKMTQRILKALENPNVDVLAHPSCRLLGERDAVAVDWEAVFQAALLTDTALEINAMPVRLDLRDIHVLRAKEMGVKLAIGTDSHSPDQLKYMRFGVSVARRGWCEAGHILNTRPLEEVRGFLKRRGSGLDRK